MVIYIFRGLYSNYCQGHNGKTIICSQIIILWIFHLYNNNVGKGLWSRLAEESPTEGGIDARVGHISKQRSSLCTLHRWPRQSTGCCNCVYVLVLRIECKPCKITIYLWYCYNGGDPLTIYIIQTFVYLFVYVYYSSSMLHTRNWHRKGRVDPTRELSEVLLMTLRKTTCGRNLLRTFQNMLSRVLLIGSVN